jgi:hypothetical protein
LLKYHANFSKIDSNSDNSDKKKKSIVFKALPSDSYIINTIKLKKIIENKMTIDEFEKINKKSIRNLKSNDKALSHHTHTNTNEYILFDQLRSFVTIMLIHAGFTRS